MHCFGFQVMPLSTIFQLHLLMNMEYSERKRLVHIYSLVLYEKKVKNSDVQQFHQYQQKPHLNSKKIRAYDIGNLGPSLE
jgi:hypothetical protein